MLYFFKKCLSLCLLIVFLGFLLSNKFVKAENQETIILSKLVINEKIPKEKIKIISENIKNKIKTIEYISNNPDKSEIFVDIEEKNKIKFYSLKILKKISEWSEPLFSGFLGIIGGYIADKVINQMEQNNET